MSLVPWCWFVTFQSGFSIYKPYEVSFSQFAKRERCFLLENVNKKGSYTHGIGGLVLSFFLALFTKTILSQFYWNFAVTLIVLHPFGDNYHVQPYHVLAHILF